MKKISKLVLAFCLSFVAFFAFGSNKAFAYSNRGPQALTSTSVYVDYKFNTVTIKFQSDTSWAAYISDDFVYSYQSQGNASGTYSLTYFVKENTTSSPREAVITIYNSAGTSAPLKFRITQARKPDPNPIIEEKKEIKYNLVSTYTNGNYFRIIADCNADDLKFYVNGYYFSEYHVLGLQNLGLSYRIYKTGISGANGYKSVRYTIEGTYYDPTYPSDHRIFTVSPAPTIKPGQYTRSNLRSFELYLRNGSR